MFSLSARLILFTLHRVGLWLIQDMPSEEVIERVLGEKKWDVRGEVVKERDNRVVETAHAFYSQISFLLLFSGKIRCNTETITIPSPLPVPRAVKSTSREFRAERGERGWEINYLAEASRFIWPRKDCTWSWRYSGIYHAVAAERGRHPQIIFMSTCAAMSN